MTHYIITYYYYTEIDGIWNRVVYVCHNMYEMIGFLKVIAEDDDMHLASVETA